MTFVLRSILTILFLLQVGCTSETPVPPSEAPDSLKPFSFCQGGILATLPTIAQEMGYFREQGLDARISLVGDGKIAMTKFLEGKCDAALTGEFPIARQSFERNDFVVIASLASSDNGVKILARRDRGISKPADLAGKRIGVSKGTISNFFFDQYLKKYRIPVKRISIVDISHRDLPNALQRGEIDAYPGSDVAYIKGIQLMGPQGISFYEPGLTRHSACLTVKKEWLATNKELVRRVLIALYRAEKELLLRPVELTAKLSGWLNIPVNDLKSMLADQKSTIILDQALLLALEDEARWMRETGIVTAKSLPNHLRFIDGAPLKGVNPDAVRLN